VKKIGSATNLAVFHIGLNAASGFVYGRMIPLPAAGTLERRFHGPIVFLFCDFFLANFVNRLKIGNWKSAIGN
jgi:hypothetical protein